jgi:hypothetical protein
MLRCPLQFDVAASAAAILNAVPDLMLRYIGVPLHEINPNRITLRPRAVHFRDRKTPSGETLTRSSPAARRLRK